MTFALGATILFVPRLMGSGMEVDGKAREELGALREGIAGKPFSMKVQLVMAYMHETGASLPEAVAALEERLGPMRDDPQLALILDALRRRREWGKRASTLTGGEPTAVQRC